MDATFWAALAAIAAFVTATVTAISTFYTGRKVKAELGPKIFIKTEVKNSENSYDKSVNEDIGLPKDHEEVGDRKSVV